VVVFLVIVCTLLLEGVGTRFAARKSADGDLLASSRGAENVKATLQQGEGKT
jgi:hypothetical protein